MATQCDPPDRPCILVVDDDPDLLALLFTELIEEGFSIVAASHGQQALDLLEHGLRPHVILIDLLLPRVSGVDVLTHIGGDRELRTIPRIVMTGSSQRAGIVARSGHTAEMNFVRDEFVPSFRPELCTV